MAIYHIKHGKEFITQIDTWIVDTKTDFDTDINGDLAKSLHGSQAYVLDEGMFYVKGAEGWRALARPTVFVYDDITNTIITSAEIEEEETDIATGKYIGNEGVVDTAAAAALLRAKITGGSTLRIVPDGSWNDGSKNFITFYNLADVDNDIIDDSNFVTGNRVGHWQWTTTPVELTAPATANCVCFMIKRPNNDNYDNLNSLLFVKREGVETSESNSEET